MKRLALAALSAFCLLLPAAAEAKKPPLTFLSNSEAGISQVGPDKGVYESPKGTLQILNLRTHATRAATMPSGCVNRGISLPSVLLLCYSDYRIWDSLSGEAKVVDFSGCGSYASNTSLAGLGRRWIGGEYHTGDFDHDTGSEFVQAVYISRDTGECKVLGPDDFDRDLDSATLPPRRYGVPEKCTKGKRYILRSGKGGLSVKRCTPRAHWRVACRSDCGELSPGRSLLAWTTRDMRLHVYLIGSRQRFSWRLRRRGYATVLGDWVFADVSRVRGGLAIYALDLSRLVRR